MLVEYLEFKKTNYGYTLFNNNMTLLLNDSKKTYGADYYLKMVSPTEKYISGMFYNKKTKLFRGKDMNGRAVKVKFLPTKAKIIID